MWNPTQATVRARWTTTPPGRTAAWFAELDRLQRAGMVDESGRPGPLLMAVMLTSYRDDFRLAVGPQPIVSGGLAILGGIGRLRGYRPSFSPR